MSGIEGSPSEVMGLSSVPFVGFRVAETRQAGDGIAPAGLRPAFLFDGGTAEISMRDGFLVRRERIRDRVGRATRVIDAGSGTVRDNAVSEWPLRRKRERP